MFSSTRSVFVFFAFAAVLFAVVRAKGEDPDEIANGILEVKQMDPNDDRTDATIIDVLIRRASCNFCDSLRRRCKIWCFFRLWTRPAARRRCYRKCSYASYRCKVCARCVHAAGSGRAPGPDID